MVAVLKSGLSRKKWQSTMLLVFAFSLFVYYFAMYGSDVLKIAPESSIQNDDAVMNKGKKKIKRKSMAFLPLLVHS